MVIGTKYNAFSTWLTWTTAINPLDIATLSAFRVPLADEKSAPDLDNVSHSLLRQSIPNSLDNPSYERTV